MRARVRSLTAAAAIACLVTGGLTSTAGNAATMTKHSHAATRTIINPFLNLLRMTATGSKAPLSESEIKPWILSTVSRVGGMAMAVSCPHYSSESN